MKEPKQTPWGWLLRRLKQRRQVLQINLFRRGYYFAAGELLQGKTPDEVLATCSLIDQNEFDAGMFNAVTDWRKMKQRATP